MYYTDKLREKRKNLGLSQKYMAEKLGITVSFYSQIENKKKRLYYDTAVKIADILNMKPDQLFLHNN